MAVEINLPAGKLQYGPYSPSRLETGICGYAFKRGYIDRDKPPRFNEDGLAADRGSVVHEVFELMNAQMINERNYAFDPNVVRKWVTEAVNRYPSSYQDIETIMSCVQLYANNPPQNLPEDAEIEQAIALDLNLQECDYDSPDAMIRGRADLLWFDDNLDVHILDYKTQPNIEEADTFQMGVYALTMARKYNLKQAYTTIYFARYGKYSKEHLWTEDALNMIEQILLARIETIENRTEWVATPHNGCQYCPHRTECPVFTGVFKVEEVNETHAKVTAIDPDVFNPHGDIYRAQKLAGVIMQLEELLSLGKGNLRNFIKEYQQPVSCGNKAFMYKPKEDFDWTYINKNTKGLIFDTMAKHGVDARKYAKFAGKEFNSVFLIEDKKAMFDELKQYLPRKVSTTFGCYKV